MISIGSPSMTHRRLILALIAGSVVCGNEPAAADRLVNCDKAVSTPEYNLCSERAWQAADSKLNAGFAGAIDFIKTRDQPKPFDKVSWEKALRASQRAWVAFREADCKGLVPMSWTGGTGTTSAVLDCMTTKTKIRTEELLAISGK